MEVLKPKFNKVYIAGPQNAKNIANQVKKSIFDSRPAAAAIAYKFRGRNAVKTCENIYNYLLKNIKYIRETGDLQTAKTLPRIIWDKYGDCKHYTTFACSILEALGIPCFMRMISQNYYDPSPTHIYCVAVVNGQEIIVDPCIRSFNTEAAYKYKYNLNLKK